MPVFPLEVASRGNRRANRSPGAINSSVAPLWPNRESSAPSGSKCNAQIARSVCPGIGVSYVDFLKTAEKTRHL